MFPLLETSKQGEFLKIPGLSRNRRKESELKERWTLIIWNQKSGKGKPKSNERVNSIHWELTREKLQMSEEKWGEL